jgi:hypothetical protein
MFVTIDDSVILNTFQGSMNQECQLPKALLDLSGMFYFLNLLFISVFMQIHW